VKGGELWPTGCLYRRRRESSGVGPSSRRRKPALSWTGEPSARVGFPCSWVADGWASVGVFKPGTSPDGCGMHCSLIRPVNNSFSIFPN
jgi:hypothetical protein